MKTARSFVMVLGTAGLFSALGFLGGERPLGAGDEVAAGKALVEAKCASCHGFAPEEKPTVDSILARKAPDLSYTGSRLQRGWVEAWLISPRRVRPAGFPFHAAVVATSEGDRVDAAKIPTHMKLTAEEARIAAAYLDTLKRDINPFPQGEPNEELRAEVHFEKILPCGGCHQARPGKGGVSGPELWSSGRRLAKDYVSSYIADPVYWTKAPMPKLPVRSDQLAAITDYLLASNEPEADATLGKSALGSGHGTPPPAVDATSDRGAAIYRALCSQCHGVTGNGQGINAPSLFVSPRDHTSFDEMSALTDDRIATAIKRGGVAVGKSALMPSWGGVLGDDDIQVLVKYLRKLSGTGEESSAPAGR